MKGNKMSKICIWLVIQAKKKVWYVFIVLGSDKGNRNRICFCKASLDSRMVYLLGWIFFSICVYFSSLNILEWDNTNFYKALYMQVESKACNSHILSETWQMHDFGFICRESSGQPGLRLQQRWAFFRSAWLVRWIGSEQVHKAVCRGRASS